MQQNFSLKKNFRFYLPAIAWIILSTVLLTLPQTSFPEKSIFSNIPWFDKWVHIGMFGIMAVLCCWGVYKSKAFNHRLSKRFIAIAFGCLLFGLAMEFVQKYWVPLRSFDIGDVVADGVGAAAGAIFSLKAFKKNRPL